VEDDPGVCQQQRLGGLSHGLNVIGLGRFWTREITRPMPPAGVGAAPRRDHRMLVLTIVWLNEIS
jgi:hypothetical protein